MKGHGYKPIVIADTKGMSNSEWLKLRSDYYGGSDLSVIANVSPWKCSLEYYNEKIGVLPKAKKDNINEEAIIAGNIYEPFVILQAINWFDKEMDVKLVHCYDIDEFNKEPNAIYEEKRMFQCGREDASFLGANLDALIKIDGKIGIFECKTTGNVGSRAYDNIKNWSNGLVPKYYDLQCRHYMATMDVDYAYIACCWGFRLDSMAVIRIERDMEVEEELISMVREFDYCVKNKISPDTLDNNSTLLTDYYTRLYGGFNENTSSPIELFGSSVELLARQVQMIELEIQDLEKRLTEKKDRLQGFHARFMEIMNGEGYGYMELDAEIIGISIKNSYKSPRKTSIDSDMSAKALMLDVERFKVEQEDIWNECLVPVFDGKTFAKKYPSILTEYQLSKQIKTDVPGKVSVSIKSKN